MTHFQVTFVKSLLNSDGHQFSCPQQVIDLDAVNAEVALNTAKRRFERLFHLSSWRMRADSANVSATDRLPELIGIVGSLQFRCPVKQTDFYSGIDTDARTFARVCDLRVQAKCPFCNTRHSWKASNGTLSRVVNWWRPALPLVTG